MGLASVEIIRGPGIRKIDRSLLFCYAVSRDDLYSKRQVKRVRNGCETAGKPKGPPAYRVRRNGRSKVQSPTASCQPGLTMTTMQLKQTILVLGEPRTLDKEIKRLEQDGPYAVVQEPWLATRAELVEKMKALSKQWSVEAILLLHGQPFKPLDEEIFSPFVPALQIVCGIAAGG